MKLSPLCAALLVTAMTLSACAAPAAPAPTSAPAKPAEKAAAPAAEPASAGTDAEWQKIVDAGKKEGKLTIYGRLLSGPEGTVIADAFKQETGISVEFVAGAGSPMFSRIKEESKAGRPTADIYQGAQPWPANIEREGYFVNIKNVPLPALKEPASAWVVDPWFMSPEGNYLATNFSDFESHIAINTRVIPPADFPKDWHDFATNPKFAGKISWVDPKTTQDIGAVWTRHGYVAKTMNLEDIWTMYAKQNLQLFPNPVDASSAVGRGEVGMSTGTTGLNSAVEAGAPVKLLLFPELPSVALIAGMGIVKDTPNMNAALVFVNWVMSKPGMEVIARNNQVRPVRRDVPTGVPAGLRAEVIGGGKRGPSYAISAAQAAFAGEVEAAGVMRPLTEGVSLEEFKSKYEAFLKDWEAKRGGPQDKPIIVTDE